MPSVMDLALCANAVYDKTTKRIGPWTQLEKPIGSDSWGFYATAYVHDNRKEMIVAYRGTDDVSDAITDVDILLGKYPNQAVHAEAALKLWRQRFKTVQSVWLTGHSLGGGLASLMADAHNLPAVTFNAPGMSRSSIPDWVPIGVGAVIAWGKSVLDSESDVLHIRTKFDLVSIGTGPRMGIVHNVPAACSVDFNALSGDNALTVFLPGYGLVKLVAAAGDYVLCQHKMMSVIAALKGNNLYTNPVIFSNF